MHGSTPLLLALLMIPAGCQPKVESAPAVATARGAELFRARCAACHPDGGNVINPKKTLHAGVLAGHGIRDAGDIVQVMRKPGPGMTAFPPDLVPDEEARLIAQYVLATFR